MAVERLLLETGDILLLETGDRLLLESSGAPDPDPPATEEPGKGWPKNRRQRRAAKRVAEVQQEEPQVNRELISAEVARAIQAQKAAKPVIEAVAPEKVEAPVVDDSGESVRLILEAWERIELRQVEELAQAEIARIQALKDEELMIVTMIAALA